MQDIYLLDGSCLFLFRALAAGSKDFSDIVPSARKSEFSIESTSGDASIEAYRLHWSPHARYSGLRVVCSRRRKALVTSCNAMAVHTHPSDGSKMETRARDGSTDLLPEKNRDWL
jgi:hypothetical protein